MAIQNEQELFKAFVDKIMEQEAIREDIKIFKDQAKDADIPKEDVARIMKVAKAYVKAAFDDTVSEFDAFRAKYEELTK